MWSTNEVVALVLLAGGASLNWSLMNFLVGDFLVRVTSESNTPMWNISS